MNGSLPPNSTFNAANGQGAKPGGAAVRYEVLEREGEGTLWVCYRVRERSTGLVCALKALKTQFAKHPRFAPTLQNTLETLASGRGAGLSHPHLASIYEAGNEDGTPYFVSDWIAGGTLENRLRRAPLGRSEALSIVRALAGALQTLHERGLAHGDVRPKQVRLMGDGSVKLTDTGEALAFHAAGLQLTDVIGDASYYQAPERWDNREPSPGADLYALGVILYRMLAARVPFDGTSPLAIAMRHRRDVPLRPSQFNANCPRDLEQITMRLLEKEAPSRYISVAHLLRDLSADNAPSSDPTPVDTPTIAMPANAVTAPAGVSGPGKAAPLFAAAPVAVAPVAANPVVAAPVAVAPSVGMVTDADDNADIEHEERVARKKHRRREFWGAFGALIWMFIAAGSLGGIFYGAYYFWVQDLPKEMKVPEYRGKSQFEVERILASKGLKFRVAREVFDPKKPSGTVLSGEPPPGKVVRTGREIAATVSRGPEPIRMYDFSELNLQQARQVAMRDGLRLGQVAEQFHDRVPAGYICGQYPEPGESFRRTDPINLIVSRGPQPSEAPGLPNELPPLPQPTAPEDDEQTPSISGAQTEADATLVSRAVQVRVVIPADGKRSEVRVVARDIDGERTVYRQSHDPGDVIDETVQVTRQQGTSATVRIYVGGALVREERV